MTIYLACALIAAGVGGGIAASVASVASMVSYPALLALGLPPLAANVTNTMALVFSVPGGMLGSRRNWRASATGCCGFGRRHRGRRRRRRGDPAGGTARRVRLRGPGADRSSSVVLILQPRLRALAPRPGAERSRWRLAAMFGVAVYVGYFGAAGGVLMLAILAATLTESLIRVNAIKNVVGGAANLVAAVIFACYAPVDWAFVPLLAVGFAVGGFAGQHLVRHLPVGLLRIVVALAGLGLAVKLGASAYG